MVLANINVPVSGGGNPSVSWGAPTFGQQGWTAYTPTLGNITLGNGSLAAKYAVDANKVVTARFLFVAGSTTTYSAGTFTISLPVPAKSVYVDPNWNSTIGIANVSCPASSNRQMGMVVVAADGAARVIVSGGPISNTVPGTWGTSSALSFTVTYESA